MWLEAGGRELGLEQAPCRAISRRSGRPEHHRNMLQCSGPAAVQTKELPPSTLPPSTHSASAAELLSPSTWATSLVQVVTSVPPSARLGLRAKCHSEFEELRLGVAAPERFNIHLCPYCRSSWGSLWLSPGSLSGHMHAPAMSSAPELRGCWGIGLIPPGKAACEGLTCLWVLVAVPRSSACSSLPFTFQLGIIL